MCSQFNETFGGSVPMLLGAAPSIGTLRCVDTLEERERDQKRERLRERERDQDQEL